VSVLVNLALIYLLPFEINDVLDLGLRKRRLSALDTERGSRIGKHRYVAPHPQLGMKTIRIFSDRIRDRIRLEGFRSVRIRVRIFNIRYRIRIRIFKSYICDVDIQSYLIRHGWHYPYSNLNPAKNMKTNMISVVGYHKKGYPNQSNKKTQITKQINRNHQGTGPGSSDS